MPPRSIRKLGLLDLAILIAGAAICLSIERSVLTEIRAMPYYFEPFNLKTIRWGGSFRSYAVLVFPVWATLSLALMAIQLRQPRPGWRFLTRQPGFVAVTVTSSVLVVHFLCYLVIMARTPQPIQLLYFLYQTWSRGGDAVAGAWLLLGMSGRWRADRQWLDRLGRGIGFCWLAFPASWIVQVIAD